MRYPINVIFGAVAFVAVLAGAGACTEVDDRLGEGLLPRNQRMEIEVGTPEAAIKTYLYREDSIPSSRTGQGVFGRMRDAAGVFGAQTGSMMLQFLPASLPYADTAKGYGIDPIIDSARIIFALSDARGDTTQVQKFDVWRVAGEEELSRDSTYYFDFPIEKYRREKLFEFTHTGRRNVTARLFPTAAGKEYLESIVNMEWKDYKNDTTFLKTYQGLYIAPAEGSPAEAAVYAASLASSSMQLYVRNHDTLDTSAIYDTLVTAFSFRDRDASSLDTGEAIYWNNVSINMMKYDYSGSVLEELEARTNGFTDTLPTSEPMRTVYVQGMGGVSTYMRLPDELVEQIRELRFKTDADGNRVGKDVAINQAVIRLWLEDTSVASMDASLGRIGSYLDMKTLTPIPDYQYTIEAARRQQQGEAGYVLPYNGYLNRSNGYYELDITAYVQQLAKEREGAPGYRYVSPAIFLGPEAGAVIGLGNSVLRGGGGDREITVKITYTVIEG
ncbi:MAG: DUF4270 domain-containing protein [Alistipes sp.]|jgi:hypothetical protein|nr:DUF4270 domain-containing protein [Alistipes sp.]